MPIINVKAISAGGFHNLALKDDGTVWAWGLNYYGQLGDGTNQTRYTHVKIPITDVKDLSLGSVHTLALKYDGTVWAWCDYAKGELGNGETADDNIVGQPSGYYNPVPGKVSGLDDVAMISTGDRFSVALKNDGTVWTGGRVTLESSATGVFTGNEKPCLPGFRELAT